MKRIILASASPRRKRLLERIGLSFEVRPARVGEEWRDGASPEEIVRQLALRKAVAVADTVEAAEEVLVIGADTVVVYAGRVLEKPAGPAEAGDMLRELSGGTHEVYTGVALVCRSGQDPQNNPQPCAFAERTSVTFGEIDNELIRKYVDSGGPMDKAGAYGIQDPMGALLVKNLCGDYYNVVGFPLHAFYRRMKSYAPDYLEPIC